MQKIKIAAVLGLQHAALVELRIAALRLWLHVGQRGAAFGQLFLIDQQVEAAVFYRQLDAIAIFDQGQRAAASPAPQRSYPIAQRPQSAVVARDIMGVNPLLSYAGLGIVALVAFYLLFRFGLPTVGR